MVDELSTGQIEEIQDLARDAADALNQDHKSFSQQSKDHRLVFDETGCRLIHLETNTIVVESTVKMTGSFLTALQQKGGIETLLENDEFMNNAFGRDEDGAHILSGIRGDEEDGGPEPIGVSVFDEEPDDHNTIGDDLPITREVTVENPDDVKRVGPEVFDLDDEDDD